MAIYAPNGYGKHRFFDAVEWAVTGTIERLNNGKPIKEEVKNEEGYILKNRDSNEDHGNVTIISEQNKVFSVNTKKKRGKMKSDFKQGDVLKISPELDTIYAEKESFCTTNLLAHDKITGFLQNYTATTMLANSEFVALLKQANTDSSKMAEVIGVSDAQLRFVTNSQSGMGLCYI